jgi:diphosphomevalonate decarboxylase
MCYLCLPLIHRAIQLLLSSQVASESHWPELVALVCVVNANKKAVSSTSGMMNRWLTLHLMMHLEF